MAADNKRTQRSASLQEIYYSAGKPCVISTVCMIVMFVLAALVLADYLVRWYGYLVKKTPAHAPR